jgi:hypothetical protein
MFWTDIAALLTNSADQKAKSSNEPARDCQYYEEPMRGFSSPLKRFYSSHTVVLASDGMKCYTTS